jgi:hypothetical protein
LLDFYHKRKENKKKIKMEKSNKNQKEKKERKKIYYNDPHFTSACKQ